MRIRVTPQHPIRSSEITPEAVYHGRREFLRDAGLLGMAFVAGGPVVAPAGRVRRTSPGQGSTLQGQELKAELTPEEDVTGYNNFYEFGTEKDDPKARAQGFRVRPWSVKVDGLVAKPATYDLEDFIKPHALEDRIYRHRCVERWSMVVPWMGFPMADLVKRVQPLGSARYVEFTTLLDPRQMPGQRVPVLQWPYVEGLRLDEATHPLALFVVGVFGKPLPNQNGAPLRHVVPWKYGFKGCKSIVRIRFTERQPDTAWNLAAPHEYGFYANVNPEVDHPRWSQAGERRIGAGAGKTGVARLMALREMHPTLLFNGYADRVASLYGGMDLRANY